MTAEDRMPGRLGPYTVLDLIGEGGMGVVYLARDKQRRTVAIKVLRPGVAQDPNSRRRLGREVETMQRVRSANVADVIDADLTCDVPYVVTRYVPGQTLDQVISEQGPLRGEALARLAGGLAEGLTAVHAAGVVHRDLKPGNVMLLNGVPVIIDFGIAQVPGATKLTLTGMFMGTPGYLSPEVIEGRPSSQASDVHAWGATVAFAATGRAPYGTGSYETIFYRIMNGQADLAGTPSALLPLLASSLARDPAHRPSALQLGAQAAVLDPRTLLPAPAGEPAGQQLGTIYPVEATRADAQGNVSGAGSGMAGAPAPARVAADALAAGGAAAAAEALGQVAADGAAGPDAGAAGLAGNGQPTGAPPPGGVAPGGVAPGGPVPRLPGRGTQPLAAGQIRPADYADVLPPVSYQPRGPAGPPAGALAGGGQVAGPAGWGFSLGRDEAAEITGSRGGYALLALAVMVIAASLSIILPVVGTLVSLAVIMLLRAAEAARRGRVLRRSARGERPSDPLVSVVSFPWFVLRSVLAAAVMSPIALAVAALVGGITFALVRVDSVPRAIACATGTFVAFYGLGPGSSGPRRQLARIFANTARSRTTQAIVLLAVGALALATVAAAFTSPSVYWPTGTPNGLFRGLHHFAVTGLGLPHVDLPQVRLPHLTGLVRHALPHSGVLRRLGG